LSKITSQQYAAALYDQLLETPTKRQDQLISDFVTTVRQHEQIKLADQIIADFITYFDFQQNTIELVLISSLPLRNLHVLAAHLSQQIRRNIIIKNLIRPQIIGGLVIYFRDQKIDFSVTSKLKIRRSSDANSPFANQDINQIITLIRDDYPLFFTDNQPPQTLSDQIEIVKFSSASRPSISQMEKQLSATLHKKVIINYHQDPQIIAGAIIEYDNQKIDTSLDHQLTSTNK